MTRSHLISAQTAVPSSLTDSPLEVLEMLILVSSEQAQCFITLVLKKFFVFN